MTIRFHPARAALFLGTALMLAPQAASSAELTQMETESLKLGTRVFQPDAVAFSANGVSVLCSQVAFSIAQTIPECFALLTEEDVAAIRTMARLGQTFTTPSGFTFSPSPDGSSVVGVSEDGRSFPVSGSADSVASGGSGMTEQEVASFLGLDSADELGSGATTGASGPTGSTLSVDGTSGTGQTAGGDVASTGSGGISVDADSSTTDSGGTTSGVSATDSGGGLSVDADASTTDSGGTTSGASATDSGGTSVDAGTSTTESGGLSADDNGTDVGTDAGALR